MNLYPHNLNLWPSNTARNPLGHRYFFRKKKMTIYKSFSASRKHG